MRSVTRPPVASSRSTSRCGNHGQNDRMRQEPGKDDLDDEGHLDLDQRAVVSEVVIR